MTEITKYICDMCGAVQELNTAPGRWESNYFIISKHGVMGGITEQTPQALCPKCGPIVFDFIKSKKNGLKD